MYGSATWGLVLALLASLLPILAAAGPWDRGDIRLVRIAGHGYAIPKSYLDAPLDPGLEQDGLFLVMLWPGLEPRTDDNWREFYKVPGQGRRVRILVDQNRSNNTEARLVQVAFNVRTRDWGELVPSGEAYGLAHYTFQRRSKSFSANYDVFVDGTPDSVTSFILCSTLGDVPAPGCQDRFGYGSTLFTVSYGRRYLDNWVSVRKAVIGRFAFFSTSFEKLAKEKR